MPRILLLAALSFVLAFCNARDSVGASITYNIQNYPSLQNGYTLSGTITTDGHVGVLTDFDITDWSYTITNGIVTDHQSFQSTGNHGSALFTATADAITLVPGGTFDQHVILPGTIGPIHLVAWQRAGSGNPDSYAAFNASSISFWQDESPGLPLGSSTWIIATTAVPEPGTLTLALLGTPCLALACWIRRRQYGFLPYWVK